MNFFFWAFTNIKMKKLYELVKRLPAGKGRITDVKLNFISCSKIKFSFLQKKFRY